MVDVIVGVHCVRKREGNQRHLETCFDTVVRGWRNRNWFAFSFCANDLSVKDVKFISVVESKTFSFCTSHQCELQIERACDVTTQF